MAAFYRTWDVVAGVREALCATSTVLPGAARDSRRPGHIVAGGRGISNRSANLTEADRKRDCAIAAFVPAGWARGSASRDLIPGGDQNVARPLSLATPPSKPTISNPTNEDTNTIRRFRCTGNRGRAV